MAKKTKSAHTWTPMREYVTTKDPHKVWTVEQNENGELRCHCPGWIFRGRTGRDACKHIEHFKRNPNVGIEAGTMAARLSWRDAFERKVRDSFEERFPFVGKSITANPVHVEKWRAFIDDLRLMSPSQANAPAPVAVLGVRRVVLDD